MVDLWERSHKGLQQGDPEKGLSGKNSPEVVTMFAAIEPFHESMVRDARDLLAASGPDGARKADPSARAGCLPDPRRGAELPERYGQDRLPVRPGGDGAGRPPQAGRAPAPRHHPRVLLLEGLYVFRPAVREIRTTITDLVQAKGHLDSTVQALRSIAGVGKPR